MRTDAQLAESVDRFYHSFWQRRSGQRPPVAVVHEGIFSPIRYLRCAFTAPRVQPHDVTRDRLLDDYEFDAATRRVFCDDWIPFSAAWRGIPWLEAWCGCPVRYSSGSLAPEHVAETVEQLAAGPLPACPEWFELLRRETERLTATMPADCWVSPSILRGASDVLGALRGLTDFYLDLYDAPATVAQVAERINQLLIQALDMHFAIVPPKRGGFGHIFGYWAPDRTICIQEDTLGMCAPAVYRDLFWEGTAQIVRHLGGCVLFHLHSTGYQHYREVLRVQGIAGLQMVIEANGPPLRQLVPVFREVLERTRLMLFIDHGFEELAESLRRLPHEGLCLLINDRYLPSERDYRAFLAANWAGDY